jgi:NAD dependent epimerase/dehydratase family enzyme
MATIVVDGQRVVPAALTRAGFRFRYPTLDSALAATLDPTRGPDTAADAGAGHA